MATDNNYEYVNEDSIHEDLRCSLCTEPFDDPLCATQCGHTYCRKCITNTFRTMSTCPACRQTLTLEDFHPVHIRPFLNQLNEIPVKCKWCSQSNIERGNFPDHLVKCMKTVVACPAAEMKCNWKGRRDQMQKHVEICLLTKVQPMITELKMIVHQQAEQIQFLYTLLRTNSKNQRKTCAEHYMMQGSAYCDICSRKFSHDDEDRDCLHFCPDTDICSLCVKKHFP